LNRGNQYVNTNCKLGNVGNRVFIPNNVYNRAEGVIMIWESDNKNWRIETVNKRLMVTNLKTGFNDNPVIYDNGHIGFDSILPKYVIAAVYDYVDVMTQNQSK